MQQVHVPSQFGVENLTVDEVDVPEPAAGEVLVELAAATINPADFGVVSGRAAPAIPAVARPPYTPGWDLAGRVQSVGAGVPTDLVGRQVVGFSLWFESGHGTQAEFVALPLANVATTTAVVDAAALTTIGLNGLTAWHAIDALAPSSQDTVLVVGANGGVGGLALDVLVDRGVAVYASASATARDDLLARGARAVFAREDGPLPEVVRASLPDGVDGVIDTASVAAAALGAIRDGGSYVTTTAPPTAERSIRVTQAFGSPDSAALAGLVELFERGALATPVARQFPLSDARSAYREFAAASRRGRIVLVNR